MFISTKIVWRKLTIPPGVLEKIISTTSIVYKDHYCQSNPTKNQHLHLHFFVLFLWLCTWHHERLVLCQKHSTNRCVQLYKCMAIKWKNLWINSPTKCIQWLESLFLWFFRLLKNYEGSLFANEGCSEKLLQQLVHVADYIHDIYYLGFLLQMQRTEIRYL